MKATIEIPDDLYRKVKAKTAMQGRRIRDVTVDLYQEWLGEGLPARAEAKPELTPEEWLEEWMRMGAEALAKAPPGPSAREILDEDRNRLERR